MHSKDQGQHQVPFVNLLSPVENIHDQTLSKIKDQKVLERKIRYLSLGQNCLALKICLVHE